MNYSKYYLWLYTKLNSPPIPFPRWESTPVAGEGKGKGKKVLFRGLAVCSEKYRLMVLAQNHHKSRFGSQLEIIEKLGICHV